MKQLGRQRRDYFILVRNGFLIQPRIAFRLMPSLCCQRCKVKESWIHQERGRDVGQRRGDAVGTARRLSLPLLKKCFHFLSLQILLRAAEVAGNDGKLSQLRISCKIGLFHQRQRTDDQMLSIL